MDLLVILPYKSKLLEALLGSSAGFPMAVRVTCVFASQSLILKDGSPPDWYSCNNYWDGPI